MKALLLTACGAGQFREIREVSEELRLSLKSEFVLVQKDGVASGKFRLFKYFTTIEDPHSNDKLAIYKEEL